MEDVQDRDDGNFSVFQYFEPFLFGVVAVPEHEDGNVRVFQRLHCPPHTHFAELFGIVVKACGVDEQAWSYGRDFHCLPYRVRRRPRHIRHKRCGLPCDCIHEA